MTPLLLVELLLDAFEASLDTGIDISARMDVDVATAQEWLMNPQISFPALSWLEQPANLALDQN